MKDIVGTLTNWAEEGRNSALVTVLQAWGSSPRQPGAHMVVDSVGEFYGSVSGGCVEAAVIQECQEVIQNQSSKRIKYRVSDTTAWDVGLACGGEIEIFISPISWSNLSPILKEIQQRDCWYKIELNEGGEISLYTQETKPSKIIPYLDNESSPEFIILYSPHDLELVIVGGVNISQHLIEFANLMGYNSTILDPRKSFANPKRFPNASKIVNLWPQDGFELINIKSNTAIVILTHDDKIDIPALKLAFNTPAFYIGALGSNKTQDRRKNALLEMGVSLEDIKRVHGPIGLDIGAKNPQEIALAIAAEITKFANKTNPKKGE